MQQPMHEEISTASSRLCLGKATLDSFVVEHFQQPAYELPETCLLTEHRIILNLGNPYNVEQWYDGYYQQNQMDTGNFTVLPIGMSRRVIWDRPIEFLLLHLEPVYMQQMVLDLSDRHQLELIPHYKRQDSLIHQIGLALKTELQSQGLGGKLYLESMMATLTIQLLRHHAHWTSLTPTPGGFSNYQLRQIINYIHSNLEQELSLDELASIAQISKYYLIRLFKRAMGVTLHRYVTTCRIEKAKQLLAQRNLSIVEICHLVGFQSQSHFTDLFHRYIGVTPKVYRDSL
ncbi:helix-turn-helix transcriptional regulator [Gloeocapsopsis crepidinum LEGE 06123]|uniref:Helix-turn-helix transcriptional regulator n=2 Tax=Gloeocapsopsis crepidinum TaxID=693223 RepID=A0ABR9URR2_9CHRO|nr:AraC family transcriptional regulator [Gloeocapsopsis crepidinum]MBE9190961.1 helix-turn-helix transcriptional regulator [Gloeocapsopsis crepidinum LEGE 06123]